MAAVESKLHRFSFQLYKALGDGHQNVVFSPHSVASALMLVCLGAKKGTYKQIVDALGLSDDGDDVHAAFKKLNDAVSGGADDGSETKIANKLYKRTDLKVLETYTMLVTEVYNGAIDAVDFATDPEGCRASINAWVEEQTNNKIKDLLQPGSITPQTNVVIANAIYFKGLWENPFKAEETKEAEYHVTLDEKVKVQMMKASLQLSHLPVDDLSLSAVAIPYKGRSVSMIILLPNEINGLASMEQSLTSERLGEICASLIKGRRFKIDISLPRFKMVETRDLIPSLLSLGVTDLFDQNVDLGGMFESGSTPITDVVHKAYIEVDEKGTEAAAATAMMSRMMLLPVENTVFRCDRPFMFCIVHNSSNSILFMGKFCRPE